MQSPAAAARVAGTPADPSVIYWEDFENNPSTFSLFSQYVGGTDSMTYTADPYWLNPAYCNGFIASYNQVPIPVDPTDSQTPQRNVCRSGSNALEWRNVRAKTYALGLLNSPADPDSNKAVSSNTAPVDGVNTVPAGQQVQFQTTKQIPFSGQGRFITFSVDAAATFCNLTDGQPRLAFELIDQQGTAHSLTTEPINPCTDIRALSTDVAVSGDPTPGTGYGPDSIRTYYGSFASDDSLLISGGNFGIRMRNLSTAAAAGNDGAFDNIRVLDVTPTLDKAFSPPIAKTGGVSTLTFTVTNTSELARKSGWSFTDTLPSGLLVAPGAQLGGTCGIQDAVATPGTNTITVGNGTLDAHSPSCTITVDVTAAKPGTYVNGPANITPSNGLNPPTDAQVIFEDPQLQLTKHAAAPVDVNQDGLADAGDSILYTFDVKNTGDVTVSNVAVSDPLVGAVNCPVTSLDPGQSTTCTAASPYTVTDAQQAAGKVDNTATANGNSPTGANVVSNPSSTSTPLQVPAAAIALKKTASVESFNAAGQAITYTFAVTNTGNVTLKDLAVTDTDFSGTGTLSAITCPSEPLAPGASVNCEATYTTTQADLDAGKITNTATATGTPPGTLDKPVSDPSTVTIPGIKPTPTETPTPTPTPTTATPTPTPMPSTGTTVPAPTPSPTDVPQLPNTGAQVAPLAVSGIGLLLAGTLMIVLFARRRPRH